MNATACHLFGYQSLRPRHYFTTATAATFLMLTLGASLPALADGQATQPLGFSAMESVDHDVLQETRGKDSRITHFTNVQSIQEMQASVSDTSFDVGGNIVSGNISFDANALGRYSGTGIFSAITGNGNSVTNAVGITVFVAE